MDADEQEKIAAIKLKAKQQRQWNSSPNIKRSAKIKGQKTTQFKVSKFNKKNISLLFFVIALIGFINFEGNIKGNIFIVTKASQSIKLGDIKVMVVPEEKFSHFLAAKRADFDSCPVVTDEFRARMESALAIPNYRGANLLIELNKERNEIIKKRSNCIARLIASIHGESINTTHTNADGQFKIPAPRHQKTALIVKAKRNIADTVENYLWVLPVNIGWGYTSELQLSNNNLMEPENYQSSLKGWL